MRWLLFLCLFTACSKPASDGSPGRMTAGPRFGKLSLDRSQEPGRFVLEIATKPGDADAALLGLLINSVESGEKACYLFADTATGKASLVNDSGSGAQVLEGKPTVVNNQCELQAEGTAFARTSTSLRATFALRFQPAFKGRKNLYLIALDAAGQGGGFQMGGAVEVK